MKKLIISLYASVFFLLSCSDNYKDTEKFNSHFMVEKKLIEVDDNIYDGANFYTLRSVNNFKRRHPKDWLVDYSSNIKKMVVLSTMPTRKKDKINNVVNDVLAFCKENGYEDAININNSGNSANLFYKTHNEKITGLIIIGIDALSEEVNQVEVRCIDGFFTSEDVKEIVALHGSPKRKNIGTRFNI
jgi:hypothetical protein